MSGQGGARVPAVEPVGLRNNAERGGGTRWWRDKAQPKVQKSVA